MPFSRPQRSLSWLVVAMVLSGALLSGATALLWEKWSELEGQRRASEDAMELEAKLVARLEAYMALLRGGAGLFAAMPEVGRSDFRRYVEKLDIPRNYPGVRGIGFSIRANAANVQRVYELAARNGIAGFEILPSHPRDEYHAVLYLEPEDERNRAAIGFDMYSEPVRRVAMERAATTGRAALSGKVTLVQEIEGRKQPGFLIYVPVYDRTAQRETEQARREHLVGFIYAPFRAHDLMQGVLGASFLPGTALALYDGSEAVEEAVLFSEDRLDPVSGRKTFSETRTLQIAGRDWTLVYAMTAPVSVFPAVAIFLGGIAITAALGFFVQRARRARHRAAQSEEHTRERENELALLIDSIPALVAYVDLGLRYRICNRTYERWLSLHRRALMGRTIREVMGDEIYRSLEPHVARALQGETVAFEQWYDFPQIGALYLSTLYVPHYHRNGKLVGFYTLSTDLTALKRAEETARFIADSGKLLSASLDYQSALRAAVHLAVPRVADLAIFFRVEREEIVAHEVAHVTPEQQQRLATFLRTVRIPTAAPNNLALAVRTARPVVSAEVTEETLDRQIDQPDQRQMLRALGLRSALHVPVVVRGVVWGLISFGTSAESGRRFTESDRVLAEELAARVRLAVENSLLYREAQQEIQERTRAEAAARESEERFRLLVEGARDYAIILLDPDGQIAAWNDGATRILGYSEGEAIGLPAELFYPEEDRAVGAPANELARAREAGSAGDERWYVRKDGTRFWASGHTIALRNHDGLLRGYAKIMRDLTGRKQAEEELEERVRQRTFELDEAVKELEAFSYSVSHDLRSPLRTIHGFTELALEEAGPRLNEVERGYLGRVQRAVARLDRLITDLLAYSRVSKKRVELRPVPLHTLVNDIVRDHPGFQPPAAKVAIEGTLEAVVGNEAYLTQCVSNLLGNAVKFVPEGKLPEVRVWTERVDRRVRLYVRDNGIGIAEESLGRVFEMFERLHAADGYEGTGVGLAIVRRAMQRMNGTVGVNSVVDEGTTFWIELPAADDEG